MPDCIYRKDYAVYIKIYRTGSILTVSKKGFGFAYDGVILTVNAVRHSVIILSHHTIRRWDER